MKIIGLTGGIGSGKSTVASIMHGFGAYIIDADEVARDVVSKGSRVLDKIVMHFGKEILNDDGGLNRRKLAEVVFNDRQKVVLLNQLTHKEVYKRIREQLKELKDKQYKDLIVLDVPIPSMEFKDMCDEIWVVDAPQDVRVERIIERSGFSREDILKRMSSQISSDDYLRIADRVINNADSLEALRDRVHELIICTQKNY